MAKSSSIYVCQQCSYESYRWFGKCPECGEWNSAVETIVSTEKSAKRKGSSERIAELTSLSDVPKKSTERILTEIPELDRVLGGGIVNGQVILIAGEPGIGKSTLLLQVANQLTANSPQSAAKLQMAQSKKTALIGNSESERKLSAVDSKQSAVIYVSGEESVSQIAIRASRLGVKNDNIQLLEDTDIDEIIETIYNVKGQSLQLQGIIIDSIQTMQTSDLSGMAGSVGQFHQDKKTPWSFTVA